MTAATIERAAALTDHVSVLTVAPGTGLPDILRSDLVATDGLRAQWAAVLAGEVPTHRAAPCLVAGQPCLLWWNPVQPHEVPGPGNLAATLLAEHGGIDCGQLHDAVMLTGLDPATGQPTNLTSDQDALLVHTLTELVLDHYRAEWAPSGT